MLKITSNTQKNNKINFTSALTRAEINVYKKISKEAKRSIGLVDDFTQIIIHDASIPQSIEENTGIGKLNSKGALNIIDTLKDLLDLNGKKVLPQGKYKIGYDYFCPYNRPSCLSLGVQNINLKNLTKSEYGAIVDNNDLVKLVEQNKKLKINVTRENLIKNQNITADDEIINYENELIDLPDKISVPSILRKAYKNFKNKIARNNNDVKKLNEEFELYKKSELEIQGIKLDNSSRFKVIDENKELEQFQFEQFLADKSHFEAKKALNDKGIELTGDLPIGFSEEEIKTFSDAFIPDSEFGGSWGLKSLDFNKMFDKKNSDGLGIAGKLLAQKVKYFMERYDRIRFDVGWGYVTPKIFIKGQEVHTPNLNDKILKNIIEKTAAEMNFDINKLSYEFGDGILHFSNGKIQINKNFKNRKIAVNTEYTNNNWGFVDFYKKSGLTEDEFIVHAGNHDNNAIRQIAEDEKILKWKNHKEGFKLLDNDNFNMTIPVLAKQLNIPQEILKQPKEFAKAKFAELYTTKNRSLLFTDILGKKIRIDNHTNKPDNYRLKLKENIEEQYHKALQEGHGFNLMESLGIVMKSKGVDKKEPELYEQVIQLAEKLREKGPLTQEEAEKTTEKITDQHYKNKKLHKSILGLGIIGVIGATLGIKSHKNNSNKKNYYTLKSRPENQRNKEINRQIPSVFQEFKMK